MTIPSTGKDVNYHQFVVRDEKSLLVAQQSDDEKVMISTLKSIIKNCIQDDIDVDSLSTFDLEYIFTMLRAKSVGEVVPLYFYCDDCDSEKGKLIVNVDITKIKVVDNEGHSSQIPLFEDVGVKMKYPTIDMLPRIDQLIAGDVEEAFSLMADCIEFIYNTDEVFQAKDQTKEELVEFLDSLTKDQLGKIETFFTSMPHCQIDVDYTCPNCRKEHHKFIGGLQSFFQ